MEMTEIETFTVLPEQWNTGKVLAPEMRLLRAMMEEAFNTLTSAATKQRERAEALQWIMSDEDDHYGSFVRVCQYLGLAPDTMRRRTHQMLQDNKTTGIRRRTNTWS